MTPQEVEATLSEEMRRAEQMAAMFGRSDYGVGGEGDPKESAIVAGSSLPFPAGDLVGLAADLDMYATDPESHNWFNYLFTAAGLLPAIPAAAQVNQVRQKLRAYHGTNKDFDKYSLGIHDENAMPTVSFSTTPEGANRYAMDTVGRRTEYDINGELIEETGQNIRPVVLEGNFVPEKELSGLRQQARERAGITDWWNPDNREANQLAEIEELKKMGVDGFRQGDYEVSIFDTDSVKSVFEQDDTIYRGLNTEGYAADPFGKRTGEWWTEDKQMAEGFARGEGAELLEATIPTEKRLRLTNFDGRSGEGGHISEVSINHEGVDKLEEILGPERAKAVEWIRKGSETESILTPEDYKKIKDAGYDSVVGLNIEGITDYVLNLEGIKKAR